MIILLLLGGVHAMTAWIGQFEKPERLEAPIHLTVTHGFQIRWVEQRSTNENAETVVFIHGTPGGAGVWREEFTGGGTGICARANLIAYDRPGFGKSKPISRHPHLSEQVDALTNLLARITTNRVWLAGHSYGGPIALQAAVEHPERIAGALLIGGDVDPGLEKILWIQRVANYRFISWLLPRSLRQCNREVLAAPEDLKRLEAELPRLSVPIVMLHGTKDQLVPVENVAWLQARLEAADKTNLFCKIVLPGVNHFIPWEHPDQVDRGLEVLMRMRTGMGSEPEEGKE